MLSDRAITGTRFSNRPLYLQLRDALAERIASGEWKPNSAIPNEGDLAREFGVSAGTMRKALDLMETERLLTRRQGKGTFVNDQSSDELAARFCNIRGADGKRACGQIKSADVAEGPANEAACLRLRLQQGDRVHRIRRVRQQKGQPYMLEEVVLPAALFPDLALGKNPGVTDRIIVLAQEYGILLGRAEERVSASGASAEVAEKLGIAPDAPVMVLDRVVLALDGRPIEWRMAWCHLVDRYYMAEMA
jgi:GntR family transcriptional regulator